VVFRDVVGNTRYASTATDVNGKYIIELPRGGRYQIDNVIADDAVTRLPVPEAPMISVVTAEKMSVNVSFAARRLEAKSPSKSPATSRRRSPGTSSRGPTSASPWSPVGIAAYASHSGSDEASPFQP
jgi:hypothetical protein